MRKKRQRNTGNTYKSAAGSKKRRKWFRFEKLKSFFGNPRLHRITGLFCLLFSLYLLLACLAFLFTWKQDIDLLSRSWGELVTTSGIRFENWLGTLGAMLSYIFIYKWFGISSFIIVAFMFIIGMRILFGFKAIHLGRMFRHGIFFLLWMSLLLACLFTSSDLLIIGGGLGYNMRLWMQGFLGVSGTYIFIGFAGLAYAVLAFDLSFHFISKWVAALFEKVVVNEESAGLVDTDNANAEKEEPEDPAAIEDEVTPTAVEINLDPHNEAIADKTPKYAGSVALEVEETRDDTSEEDIAPVNINASGEYDPTLDLPNFKLPGLNLLKDYGSSKSAIGKEEHEANSQRIINTLANYNISIDKIMATPGPTVTLYEIIPTPGTRISKIKNLEDDIALSLSALGIRIIAPMPGKGTIGIEVPNSKPQIVGMRSVINSERFAMADMALPVALGKTISNETFVTDLAKMPHLLMAGATGQGKSVGLNAVLVSLLYKKHPSQIKFVLVDPKKVELSLFNKIERHYLAKLPDNEEAIITDTKTVVNTLNSLCIEMDARYDLLKLGACRNITEYNKKFIARKLNPNKGHRFMPYIVLVVDEFADLIMTAGKEVEAPIARLAQLARAIGIHLIIATQRPSVNIITGTIKANFPSRIAFRVTSKVDSRTILDAGGADQLIGKGDMLFSSGSKLIRLQCAFVDTPEVDDICDYIGAQKAYPNTFELPEYVDERAQGGNTDTSGERDALFDDAARLVVTTQSGSTSMLQRRLKLGYNRAGRLIDQLEDAGIIGPFEGSKARQVLIPDEYSLEQLLNRGDDDVQSNDTETPTDIS